MPFHASASKLKTSLSKVPGPQVTPSRSRPMDIAKGNSGDGFQRGVSICREGCYRGGMRRRGRVAEGNGLLNRHTV